MALPRSPGNRSYYLLHSYVDFSKRCHSFAASTDFLISLPSFYHWLAFLAELLLGMVPHYAHYNGTMRPQLPFWIAQIQCFLCLIYDHFSINLLQSFARSYGYVRYLCVTLYYLCFVALWFCSQVNRFL